MCSAQASVRDNSELAVAAFILKANSALHLGSAPKLGHRSAFSLSFTLQAKEEREGEI